MMRRRAAVAAAPLLLAGLLAACQPLPHPFADDRPPAALLVIRDSSGVAIAPLVGQPSTVARKLGAAIADALLKRDIPASEKTTNLDSYRLYGRVAEARPKKGRATVTALWRLYDAKGRTVGERSAHVEATTKDWGPRGTPPLDRLAQLSAEALAPLLEDKPPVAAAVSPDAGRIRVAVDKITGAPGDGATSLANAVATVLQRHDLAMVKGGAHADLYVSGDVVVSPPQSGKQHVRIAWRVRRADGAEIGTVGQENDIPKGFLDGPWGDVAYSIAIAAGDGLMQLVDRGAPAPKS